MIDITGVDLVKLVQAAFDLSRAQGMGFLHYQPGHTLSDEEARKFIKEPRYDGDAVINMDYVQGRACKFRVFREGERLVIPDLWFDHADGRLRELLNRVGLDGAALLAAREAA